MPKKKAEKKPKRAQERAKKAYHHGSLRQALQDSALRLIQERGHIDFNLREISKACGVSVAAVYRHFPSKDDLILELARTGFERLGQDFRESQSSDLNEERLQQLGMAYVRFAVRNEGLFRVMFSRSLCEIPGYPRISAVADAAYAMLEDALQSTRSPKRGELLQEQTVRSWAVVHGLAHLWMDRNLDMREQEFLEMSAAVLKHH